MTPRTPDDVQSIFGRALQMQSRADRAAYLDEACGPDASLRAEVEGLLAALSQAGEFMRQPAAAAAAEATGGYEPSAQSPGSRIGPYKLLQKLGEGGMGTVWVAEQTEPVKRRVALKVIKPGMDSRQVLRRFEAERQALALMDHTHIAKVFDAGTTAEGRPYFVMELVKGAPITKYCDELHLPIRERLELFVPVCQAIQHAHQKGIIHRDVKPSNVLVAIQDGKPIAKVIDFGVAKALHQRLTEESVYTEIGQMVGTLEYMSPEQAELSVLDIDTRADIYALGAVLYELLTGSTPLDRKRLHNAALAETLRLIKEEEPPKPSTRLTQSKESLASLAAQRRTEPAKLTRAVQGELDWIVMKCLEKDRTRRYDSANSLARDVERYLHDEPVEACPPSAGYRLRRFARKYRMPVTVAAAFGLLLVAGIVVSTRQAVRATRAEGEAVAERDLATEAKAEATTKRQEAEAAREQARTAEARSRRLYYAASMGLVQAEWENHHILHVYDLLAETADLPERGFEWYYWQRLCRVEHLTLLGHKGGVTAVAFSPDGQRLVTGGTDRTARLWDAGSGQELLCLRGHRSQVTAVAFTPDGQRLVTGSTDGTAKVWDVASGRELRTLQGENTSPIWSVAVTPGERQGVSPPVQRVVAGTKDGTVRVWDATTGKELRPLRKHAGPIWAVALGPDGQRLYAGGQDGTARAWDLANDRELFPPLKLPGEVTSIALSADGERLMTGCGGRGGKSFMKLWDAASGREIQSLEENSGIVTPMTLTPDGQRLVKAYYVSSTAKIWDLGRGQEVLTLVGHRHSISSVAVSPDGQRLATASWEGTARVWDMASGRGTRTLKKTAPVYSLAVTPDGQRIITGNMDGTAAVWDTIEDRELLSLKGHTVLAVAVTPDGQRIVTGGDDGTARVWDAASGRELLILQGKNTSSVSSVAVTSDGRHVVTGYRDGTARFWDIVSGRELLTLKGHSGQVDAVAVTPNGQLLVTGSTDGTAKVWDATTGRVVLTLKGHISWVQCVAVNPDGQRLVTGGYDGTARVWDMASGQQLFSLEGHTGPVQSITVTPDGQRIITGSWDHTARIWDAVSGRELLVLKGHTEPVWSVAITSDGRRVITGSLDRTVRIWEAATPDQVALWARQEQEAIRGLGRWQRPVGSAPGFIRDWLVLAPLALDSGQREAEGLEREQLPKEAILRPRAGDRVSVGGREYSWQAHRGEEPVLDFNHLAGKLTHQSVAYAVCYVISAAERNDLLLQVGSDDQAKVYLNGQEVYVYNRPRTLVALDPIGPVTLHKGTNVLALKVVNEAWDWEACARFVDQEGNPVSGLHVRLTPDAP